MHRMRKSGNSTRGFGVKALASAAVGLALIAGSVTAVSAADNNRSGTLMYSTTSDRSNLKPLRGTVPSKIYVVLNTRRAVDVTFSLDAEPNKTYTEKESPYDFRGGSWEDGSAFPFETAKLPKQDSYTLTAVVKRDRNGSERTLKATFRVAANGGPVTPPTSITPTTAKPVPTTVPKPVPTTTPPTTAPKPPTTGGWPTTSNTGVPAGTDISDIYVGSLTLGANTVIDGKTINGCVTVTGKNVKITRSKIQNCNGFRVVQVETSGSVTIEDSELAGRGNDDGIAGSNYTLRRVYVHGANDGAKLDNNVLIEDSYLSTQTDSECHCDALQTMGATNVVIRHNRLVGGSGNAAIQLGTEFGSHVDFIVENNLLSGGGYTINYGNHTPALGAKNKNVIFRNNQFVPDGGWNGGRSAVTIDDGLAGITWTNNAYTDGKAIPSPV